MNLYNEVSAYPAQWIRNLVAAGHVSQGVVDERSICDLKPEDVRHATQAHFFAGIGVWSHALRVAGWPDERPVWTGSCPCQPFSTAKRRGRGGGIDDDRHLWPEWYRLIDQCRPEVVLGEQVASQAGLGWLDAVHADLESSGYAVGTADLCAAGVGAPHVRQRLYFVAVATERRRPLRRLVDSGSEGSGRNAGTVPRTQGEGGRERGAARRVVDLAGAASPTRGFWSDAEWISCRDGKARPVEPGSFPLVDGDSRGMDGVRPPRTPQIHGYGNAVCAPLATEFVRAVMEVLGDTAGPLRRVIPSTGLRLQSQPRPR